MTAHTLVMIAMASALLMPDSAIAQSAPQQPPSPNFQRPPDELVPIPDDLVFQSGPPKPAPVDWKAKVVFSEFYIETISKPKGWAERFGDAVRNPQNVKIAGDVVEKFGFPREAAEWNWKYYEAQANLIGPSETTKNGEEETGFFRSPPGYTFCNAELLDEPDIHQMTNHHVTYLVKARRIRNPDGFTADDGLLYKIVVPRVADESTWVKSHIRIIYIEADRQLAVRLTEEGKCVPHNVCPWVFQDGNPKLVNLVKCDPNDLKRDRWAPP